MTAGRRRLPLPGDVSAPLGCDAVSVPANLGPRVLALVPRVGCVYADDTRWWWVVPEESDHAMDWPEPAEYVRGALLSRAGGVEPRLLHRSDDTVPYTPPIPLYLALCRVTDTLPTWLSHDSGRSLTGGGTPHP
ncbi:hypothetical protein AAH978_05130 [Streptomyces sp. ZYX-F-203]